MYIPNATVVMSRQPRYRHMRNVLSFYYAYIITPLSIGIKMMDPSIDNITNRIHKEIKNNAEYSYDLEERYILVIFIEKNS